MQLSPGATSTQFFKGKRVNPFWHNIFRSRGYEQTLNYFLSTIPAFNKLDKRELALLEKTIHVRNYAVDESVFNQGDIGSGMYIVRSGRVQVFTTNELGHEVEQAILEPGDFFGEIALTASRPRNASARATENTVLVGLFRSDFMDGIKRYPVPFSKILIGLNRVISDRLLQCCLQLEDLKKRHDLVTEHHGHE